MKKKDKTGKDVIIVQVGTKLSNLGVLTLSNGTVKSEIISKVPIFPGYEYYKIVTRDGKDRYVDPDMEKFLENLTNSHEKEIKEFVGNTAFDMITIDDKESVISRNQENNLCDLVADSLRNYYNSDICFLISRCVRNNIYKGNITAGDILNVLPITDSVVQLKIPGRDILYAIEYGMKSLPNKSGKFLQVSGIKFKVYDNIPSPVKVDDFDNYVKIEGERRVFDVFVGNEKLDENKNYTVSLPDFMADGGDGYTMFTHYKITNNTQRFIFDACKNYIQNDLNKKIPDIYRTNQGRIVKKQKKNDIIIIHTNDVHCGIIDKIGYDGLMLFKKELLTKYQNVLLVDAGDHIQGGAVSFLSRGNDNIKIMNELEYNASTLGNHEFDYKLDQLYNLSKSLKNGYINANFCFRKNKTAVFDPYKIVEIDNKKIGFIGVLTPLTFNQTFLHTLVDKDGNYIYDFLTERNGQELYETIQKYINELRNDNQVDYVIILSHLGFKGDQEGFGSEALLRNIEGVDAIIDGHSHQVYNKTSKNKTGKDIIITQASTKLSNVGVLTIRDGKIISELFSEIPLFEGYKYYDIDTRDGKKRYIAPDMNKFLKDIIKSHEQETEEVVGQTDFDMIAMDENATISRIKENGLCDLIADSYKNYIRSDICLLDSSNVRGNFLKGNITYGNILTVLPFSNLLIEMKLPGKEILDVLEYGVKSLPNASGKFLQVSGIKFKVYDNIPSPVKVDDFDNYVKIEGERRVFDVFVGNEKLDENKVYTLSLPDFIANGGSGFTMFTKYNISNYTEGFMSEVFKKYIQKDLNKKIPDIYNTTQGRIIIMQKSNSEYFIKYLRIYCILMLSLLI